MLLAPGDIIPRAGAANSAATRSMLVVEENVAATANGPVFRPLKVMVNAVLLGMVVVVVVMMMLLAVVKMIRVPVVAVGVDDVAVMDWTDVEPTVLSDGLTASKKPAG